MRLSEHEEIIGKLRSMNKKGNNLVLLFTEEKRIEIPSTPDDEEKIKKYIGKKISIFFLDNSYFFREIEGDKNAEEKK